MALVTAEGLRVALHFARQFSISCVQKDWEREARFMNRLLSNNLDRKIQSSHSAGRAVKLLDKRRIAVLNKMYMSNVSQALTYGDFPELVDKGVQITRVSVKDTTCVEVFWVANEFEDLTKMEMILSSAAGKVRNKLMYGKMMGNVPRIVFKRDLLAVHLNETLKLLDKVSLAINLEKSLSPEPEGKVQPSLVDLEAAIPEMRMDTFGLPYNKIFKRIKEAKTKSYPLKAPVPPTPEEFKESTLNKFKSTASSVEERYKRKKELQQFITLYKKSALNSSLRKSNLQAMDHGVFYHEDGEDGEDIHTLNDLEKEER